MSAERKTLPTISRRKFLIGASALMSSALLSACRPRRIAEVESATATPEPTKPSTIESTDTPPVAAKTSTKEAPKIETPLSPTETTRPQEATPTKEVVWIAGIMIDEAFLREAYKGVGGGQEVEPSIVASATPETSVPKEPEEMSFFKFITEYVAEARGEKEIPFESLTEPRNTLFALIASGTYLGAEGVYSPGEEIERISGTSFLRLQIKEFPTEASEWTVENGILPPGFTIASGTYMTVVGDYTDETGAKRAVIAFDDWNRKKEEAIAPRLFLTSVPAASLENLLTRAGASYDEESGEIHFENPEGEVVYEMNRIEGEAVMEMIKEEVGMFFVNRMNGELVINPVVPYPPEEIELPADWQAELKEGEDGKTFVSLFEIESESGEPVELAQARYDEEKEGWIWEKVGLPELNYVGVPEVDPEILQNCIDQGFICMPLPCHPEGVKEAEFLPYYKGPDPKDENKEIEIGLFGINLEPGTIVVAPFDGEMSWWRGGLCDKELFEKRGWDKSKLVDWDYYRMFLRTELPSGQVIDLEFYPGEVEVLAPELTRASGAVFPLHPVSAGTPIFRYIGGLNHEANPEITQSKFFYNQDGPGFIKREISQGLMIEGWFGFPEERDKGAVYQQHIGLLKTDEGRLIYILPKK